MTIPAMSPIPTNASANQALAHCLDRSALLMATLLNQLATYNRDSRDWGEVGNIGYVNQSLENIVEFLGIRVDNACPACHGTGEPICPADDDISPNVDPAACAACNGTGRLTA